MKRENEMKLSAKYLRPCNAASVALLVVVALATCVALAAEQDSRAKDNKYLLEKQPKEAQDVDAVREDAKDQQDVTVVGRIGGRANPWVKNVAAFSIVDRSRKPCNEIPGDTCQVPWDYCCEPDLAKSTLLVMFYDQNGKLVKEDARKLLGVDELDTVIVQGRAKRDKAGNVSILASKLYVSPDKNEERTQ
jgi:hypothetical protein